jgi:hypothetical protein
LAKFQTQQQSFCAVNNLTWISMSTVSLTGLCFNGHLVACEGSFPHLRLSELGGRWVTKFQTWKKSNWLSGPISLSLWLRVKTYYLTSKNVFMDSQ